jgi:hypothetical protein
VRSHESFLIVSVKKFRVFGEKLPKGSNAGSRVITTFVTYKGVRPWRLDEGSPNGGDFDEVNTELEPKRFVITLNASVERDAPKCKESECEISDRKCAGDNFVRDLGEVFENCFGTNKFYSFGWDRK